MYRMRHYLKPFHFRGISYLHVFLDANWTKLKKLNLYSGLDGACFNSLMLAAPNLEALKFHR